MKTRNLLILIAALALCVGLTYWSRSHGRNAGAPAMVGREVLPGLPVNSVAKIVLRNADGTITMAKVNGIWVSVDKFNYPLNFTQVRTFLQTLADLKIGQCVRASKSQLPNLQLVQPGEKAADQKNSIGTSIVLKNAAGKEIASMLLGKLHRSEPTENTGSTIPRDFGGMPDGRYVMVKGNVLLISNTMELVPTSPTAWFDTQLCNVQIGDVTDLLVDGPIRAPIRVSRQAQSGDLVLEGLEAGKKTSKTDADSMAGALGYFRFEDVADPALPDVQTGLDKAVSFTIKTRNGTVYNLKIGKTAEGSKNRYAKLTVSFEPPPTTAETQAAPTTPGSKTNAASVAAAQAKQREAIAREEANTLNAGVKPWTYLVSEAVVRWCMKDRATLMMAAKAETPSVVEEIVPPPPLPPMPPIETNITEAAPAPEQPAKEAKKSKKTRKSRSKKTSDS